MATLNLVQARFEVNEARVAAPATVEAPAAITAEERGLTVAAMGGAALGAIAGAVAGAPFDGPMLEAFGAAGTMLGSLLATVGWCLFATPQPNR